MLPAVSRPFRGRTQGRAILTRTLGGVSRNRGGGVSSATLPFSAGFVRVSRPRLDDPSRASGTGEDGSDPPI